MYTYPMISSSSTCAKNPRRIAQTAKGPSSWPRAACHEWPGCAVTGKAFWHNSPIDICG